eukprot:TRINITY_DN10209_c0_g1_i1.p1 TRINITY_DN10209_c0_g1~~TRINITY_DN10209_c0_g1_i1.p1  ORF type:complete len:117 (+),score=6.35 TRINITY_DN10209_c0_g1_i1:147-497(+)
MGSEQSTPEPHNSSAVTPETPTPTAGRRSSQLRSSDLRLSDALPPVDKSEPPLELATKSEECPQSPVQSQRASREHLTTSLQNEQSQPRPWFMWSWGTEIVWRHVQSRRLGVSRSL